jgi:hypothetical protein
MYGFASASMSTARPQAWLPGRLSCPLMFLIPRSSEPIADRALTDAASRRSRGAQPELAFRSDVAVAGLRHVRQLVRDHCLPLDRGGRIGVASERDVVAERVGAGADRRVAGGRLLVGVNPNPVEVVPEPRFHPAPDDGIER